MKNMELPADTQTKVINYLLYTEAGLEHRKELEDFQQMISPSIEMEVTRIIFGKVNTCPLTRADFDAKRYL